MQLITLALVLPLTVFGSPLSPRQDFHLDNGKAAIALNEKFAKLTADSPCTAPENACVNGGFAQCVTGKYVIQKCPAGTTCAALPLVNSAGTSIACDTEDDIAARIAATGATSSTDTPPDDGTDVDEGGGGSTDDDIQSSLTLDPSVICTNCANDGQDTPVDGQVPSLTTKNNFINFCATKRSVPLTNGAQVRDGSCSTTPMGFIPSTANMPSCKFVFPQNLATIKANEAFTIRMAIRNMDTGNFVNAQKSYFAAPQTLNDDGVIRGHSHVVIEEIESFEQTSASDPNVFAFFKGLNGKAVDGELSAQVDKGLPAGFYKMCSINSSSNHQPVLGPIAQHASFDDCSYFKAE